MEQERTCDVKNRAQTYRILVKGDQLTCLDSNNECVGRTGRILKQDIKSLSMTSS
jgi:hypothetical protein